MPVPDSQPGDQARIAEIADLLYEYCDLVDANRQADVVALFAMDAEYDHGHGRVYHGSGELSTLFAALDLNEATSHHLSNVRIQVADPVSATCHSYVYAYHRRLGSGDEVHLWGRYDDIVTCVSGRWRFCRRRLTAAAERGIAPDAGYRSRYELIPRVGRDHV
jgi:SnoaL-like domain